MKLAKSKYEVLIAVLSGFFIVTWIGLLSKFVIPHLIISDLFGNQYFTLIGSIFFSCIITPLWEELFYRHIPFQIMKKVNYFTKDDFTIITLFLTSLIFALAHQSNGIICILYQGVGGFVLGLVYLFSKRSYLCSVITHAVWNLSVLFILPLFS